MQWTDSASLELHAGALERVNSAILIADATAADQPIVYMNPAFETLTGYGPKEVLGQNCRFLQGSDRNQESRRRIREALQRNAPVRAVLRNYRKDGTLFYNELFVDPIFGPDGKVTHFVSCQNVVAGEHSPAVYEQAASRYTRLTRREREVFERLANGCSTKVIAYELGISPRTAEKHRLSVLNKMEVSNLTLIVRYAIALAIPFKEPA